MPTQQDFEITDEITDSMIEAGVREIYAIDLGYNERDVVLRIFSSMARLSPKATSL